MRFTAERFDEAVYFVAEVRNVEKTSVDRGGCVRLIVHWQR